MKLSKNHIIGGVGCLSAAALAWGALTFNGVTRQSITDAVSSVTSPQLLAVITVDESIQYQSIAGFGGFGAKRVWWDKPPYFDQKFVDLLIHDLGITILRDEIPTSFEIVNDNDDPDVIELSRFNLNGDSGDSQASLEAHFDYLESMHQSGLDKLIVSVWSPPVWMKHNLARGNGTPRGYSAPPYTYSPDSNTNQLKRKYYEEFAEYCVAYIRLLKLKTGIDLYAISLQNEPRFSQFYASAVYDPPSLVELIKVVGRRFRREGIQTKIMAPEDVNNFFSFESYSQAILNDSEAEKYTEILAIHNYRSDGVSGTEGNSKNWRKTFDLAEQHDKPIWMTETSGFGDVSITDGITFARSMYNALHFGGVSAWLYWQISTDAAGGLISSGGPNILYAVSQQFYRHIPPESQRINVTSTVKGVLPLAFYTPDRKKVVILINDTSSSIKTRMNLGYSALGEVMITDSVRRYRPLQLNLKNDFLLPGESVITMVFESGGVD